MRRALPLLLLLAGCPCAPPTLAQDLGPPQVCCQLDADITCRVIPCPDGGSRD